MSPISRRGFPGSSVCRESACSAGDQGLIPWGWSPGEANGNPLQYSCLEILMDRGAWWATVHGVTWVGYDQQLNHDEYDASCKFVTDALYQTKNVFPSIDNLYYELMLNMSNAFLYLCKFSFSLLLYSGELLCLICFIYIYKLFLGKTHLVMRYILYVTDLIC